MSGNLITPQKIDEYLDWMRTMRYSKRTIEEYGRDLRYFEAWTTNTGHTDLTTWDKVEAAISAYLDSVNWKPNSVRRRIATYKAYAKWCGHLTLLHRYRAPKPAPAKPHPLPEGQDGVVAMCRVAQTPRQEALFALTGFMGLRANEAISVRASDVDTERMELTIRGKGEKFRVVPIPNRAWYWIKGRYEKAKRNDDRLANFSHSGALGSITAAAKRAKLSRHTTSHDMRATFATAAYERSNDIRAVQELLGHASIVTTQVYVDVSEERMRKAAG